MRGPGEGIDPRTARYGGNTTCIEVRTDAGALLILDGGTGLFPLAQHLVQQGPVAANIFITHSHWDHIHGLPFFAPLFVKGNRVRLHGAHDEITGHGIEHVMNVQLQNSYFPVGEAQMSATLDYRTLDVGVPIALEDAVVSNVAMNHPVLNLGYRIDCNGKSLFFTGDHEPWPNPHPAGSAGHAACEEQLRERERRMDAVMRGVDALIVDCSYTREEYPSKLGWGHGTFDGAFDMALRVGARALYCTHHEPTRGDDELEAVFAGVMARYEGRLDGLQVFLACEGLEVDLG